MSHRFAARALRAAVTCVLAASTALQPTPAAAQASGVEAPAPRSPTVRAASAVPGAPPVAAQTAAPQAAATPAAPPPAPGEAAGVQADAVPPRAESPEASPNGVDSLYLAPPFRGEPQPRAGAPLRPWVKPPPPPEPAVHFVGLMGFDVGGTTVVRKKLTDGSTPSISASQGFDASLGVAFLKALGGRLATQATIGIEGWSIDASDGSVQWIAFPLDVMEFVYVDPFRFGAGVSYLINPHTWGTGVAEGDPEMTKRFKNSLGLALEADWVSARFNARRARVTAGVRYAWQKLQERGGGPLYDASSFAFLLGFTG